MRPGAQAVEVGEVRDVGQQRVGPRAAQEAPVGQRAPVRPQVRVLRAGPGQAVDGHPVAGPVDGDRPVVGPAAAGEGVEALGQERVDEERPLAHAAERAVREAAPERAAHVAHDHLAHALGGRGHPGGEARLPLDPRVGQPQPAQDAAGPRRVAGRRRRARDGRLEPGQRAEQQRAAAVLGLDQQHPRDGARGAAARAQQLELRVVADAAAPGGRAPARRRRRRRARRTKTRLVVRRRSALAPADREPGQRERAAGRRGPRGREGEGGGGGGGRVGGAGARPPGGGVRCAAAFELRPAHCRGPVPGCCWSRPRTAAARCCSAR